MEKPRTVTKLVRGVTDFAQVHPGMAVGLIMGLVRAWLRDGLRAVGMGAAAPLLIVASVVVFALFGGFGGLGSLPQAVDGPDVPFAQVEGPSLSGDGDVTVGAAVTPTVIQSNTSAAGSSISGSSGSGNAGSGSSPPTSSPPTTRAPIITLPPTTVPGTTTPITVPVPVDSLPLPVVGGLVEGLTTQLNDTGLLKVG